MRERLPAVTALVLLASLVAGTWWAAHYTSSAIDLDPPPRHTHDPDSWAENFVMLRTDEHGIAINRLEGVHMVHYPDDDSYHFTQATAITQHKDNPMTTATSDTAVMDQAGERIQMIGNAYVIRHPDTKGDIFSIRSPHLTVYPDQDLMQTDAPATVINGAHTLQGKGMYYDNTSRQLQVLENSKVTLTPSNTSRATAPSQ